MLDLFNNHYDLDTLKKNIYALNLLDIIKTQKLDSDFVMKYVLNKNFQLTKEEENITIIDILKWQPHLLNTNLLVDHLSGISKVDSWNEFELV